MWSTAGRETSGGRRAIVRDVTEFRNVPNKMGGRAHNLIQTPQPPGQEANVKGAAVVKPSCNKRMNEGGSSARGGWAGYSKELAQLALAFAAKEVDLRSIGKFLVQCDAKVADNGGEGKVGEISSEGN